MAFFSKPAGKKSSAASDQFRAKMAEKLGVTAEQNFAKKLQERVDKDIASYTKAKVNAAKARGANPNEVTVSDSTKKMLTILAQQKMQNEMKKEKKQALALEKAKKAKKNAEETAKKNLQYQNEMKVKQELEYQQKQLEYQQASSAQSYFFGHSEE